MAIRHLPGLAERDETCKSTFLSGRRGHKNLREARTHEDGVSILKLELT